MTILLRCLIVVSALSASAAASGGTAARAAGPPAIAAASDLKFALPAVAKAFTEETGQAVTLTFGASGMLATQIANGAPFELFLSADEPMIENLNAKGLLRDAGQVYALGRLAVFAPEGSPVTCDADLTGLRSVLIADPALRVALANPAHAPYGRAAQSALESAGIWRDAEPNAVLGENVAQALQFATDGGAAVALVSAPLVEAPEFTASGCHERVADRLVQPLRQRLALTKTAGEAATQFAAYITSEKGRAILEKYGFSFPGQP